MISVGVDVSKGKSMVAILKPFGEVVYKPFEIKHTTSDINSLVKLINSVEGESRIVMEHTGRYYEAPLRVSHSGYLLSPEAIKKKAERTI